MILTRIILLISLLTSPAPTLSPAQRHAAEVAAGEVSALLFGVDAYTDALCSILARRDNDSFPDTLPGVLQGYFAQPRPLTANEEAAALRAFYGDGCEGVTFLWVMSGQDVERRGFRDGDRVYRYEFLSGAVWEVHFYSQSPWG